jgi:hypothetical protein
VTSHIGKDKLRAVEHLKHYDVALLHSCLDEGVAQAVYLLVYLRVGPLAIALWVDERITLTKAIHITHESFYPCVSAFEYFLKVWHK